MKIVAPYIQRTWLSIDRWIFSHVVFRHLDPQCKEKANLDDMRDTAITSTTPFKTVVAIHVIVEYSEFTRRYLAENPWARVRGTMPPPERVQLINNLYRIAFRVVPCIDYLITIDGKQNLDILAGTLVRFLRATELEHGSNRLITGNEGFRVQPLYRRTFYEA